MHILIASGIYPPKKGGAATAAYEMAQEAIALGHVVTVITYGEGDAIHHVQNGMKLITVQPGWLVGKYLQFFLKLKKSITDRQTLVICTDIFSSGIPALLCRLHMKFHLCVRLGGEKCWENRVIKLKQPLSLSSFWNGRISLLKILYKIYYRLFFHYCSLIIFNSLFLKSALLNIVPIPEERTLISENLAYFDWLSNQKIHHNQTQQTTLRFLSIGRFLNWKNIEMLIQVFKALEDEGVDFRFDIYGSGPQYNEYIRLAHASRKICIHNELSNDSVYEVMARSDLFLVPSLTETYSFAALEALSVGLPVYITSEGGLNDGLKGVVKLHPQDIESWYSHIRRFIEEEGFRAMLTQDALGNSGFTVKSTDKLIAQVIKRIEYV